ncbi:hypothetical protein NEISUBOT_03240 [Neisseria subflava NJ9703]|uniref:Uncharacterized protein n=1 Tax=Neisseria subflava NJ9703 TaxID=546268 RepID=A0A9W5N0G6_NEISU|nr:hypothetical protein NEISUBOT_03240 [Neisseria subflava NJ9703]
MRTLIGIRFVAFIFVCFGLYSFEYKYTRWDSEAQYLKPYIYVNIRPSET